MRAQDNFGELVRRYRISAGLTQEELADRSGLGVRTISNLERGHTFRPRRTTLNMLSQSLNLAGIARDELAAAYLARFGISGYPAATLSKSAPRIQHGSDAKQASDSEPAESTQKTPTSVRQLPAATRYFVGREAEFARLDELADRAVSDNVAVAVCTIAGLAGVGKSALAIQWARSAAGRFPDGQLYLNLRGFDASDRPISPAEAIHNILENLQIAAGRIPIGLDAREGLYRSILAEKRMLIVLDNAYDAAQVRPLLPGSPSCSVLVTSRRRLTSLVAAGDADYVTLDVLTDAQARELLERRLGSVRIAGELAAVDELVSLCGSLPLALTIVAARAAVEKDRPLTGLVAELRDERGILDALDTGDPTTSLRAKFSWSYQELSDPAACMFRLLGLHTEAEVSSHTAARLAGVGPAAAHKILMELTEAHLLTQTGQGRFALHVLLRNYARERAVREQRALRDGHRPPRLFPPGV